MGKHYKQICIWAYLHCSLCSFNRWQIMQLHVLQVMSVLILLNNLLRSETPNQGRPDVVPAYSLCSFP